MSSNRPEPTAHAQSRTKAWLAVSLCASLGLCFSQSALANANAADTTNADQLYAGGGLGLNLTGTGVVVGIWDGGTVRDTHQEFGGRVTVVGSVSLSSHATHVAGTIGASGVQSNAQGMAPGVSLISYNDGHYANSMDTHAGQVDIGNNSIGVAAGWFGAVSTSQGVLPNWTGDRSMSLEDEDFGNYNGHSRNLDRTLFENPHFLSVWAAGNERNDSFASLGGGTLYRANFASAPPTSYVSHEGGDWYVVDTSVYAAPVSDGNNGAGFDSLVPGGQTAKNTLVVGAMHDYTAEPHDGSAMAMSSFSSYGGTDDGRLGVSVVANGIGLTSSTASSDTSYSSYSGTSMASPNAAGTAALLLEHFRNEKGNPTLKVNSATQRGYIMHTATDVTSGDATVGPDYATGYGMINAATAATFISEALTEPEATREDWLFEDTKIEDALVELLFKAIGGEVKATMVWTDPEGSSGYGFDARTPQLVNDLDLFIMADGTTYNPWTLDIEIPELAAVQTGANHLDNVEQVYINALTADTTFSVFVSDTGVLQDGFQDYSLLVSGAVLIPEPTSLALLGLGGLLLTRRRWMS